MQASEECDAVGRANAVVDDLVSLAMEEGFERCLLEIAKTHDNKTGQWLDVIESDVLSTLKGSLAAGAAGVRRRRWERRRRRWRRSSRNSATAWRRTDQTCLCSDQASTSVCKRFSLRCISLIASCTACSCAGLGGSPILPTSA